jgi:hypothetical protein
MRECNSLLLPIRDHVRHIPRVSSDLSINKRPPAAALIAGERRRRRVDESRQYRNFEISSLLEEENALRICRKVVDPRRDERRFRSAASR